MRRPRLRASHYHKLPSTPELMIIEEMQSLPAPAKPLGGAASMTASKHGTGSVGSAYRMTKVQVADLVSTRSSNALGSALGRAFKEVRENEGKGNRSCQGDANQNGFVDIATAESLSNIYYPSANECMRKIE